MRVAGREMVFAERDKFSTFATAMETLFAAGTYWTVVCTMAVLAVVVFVVLQRIDPGYGMTYTGKWGPSVNNRLGWVLMELPAFATVGLLWAFSPRGSEVAVAVMAGLFELHYAQRTFVFPMLMRGRSRMPLLIMAMGIVFNCINGYIIGGWLFYVSPAGMYGVSWLWSAPFVCGVLLFAAGMAVNLHSDHIIRSLRKPGDKGHYIPYGGMYRYVTGANYFGELLEWVGYAVLTWSVAVGVFVLWTFANLAPRARATHRKYVERFGDTYRALHRRYIIPHIY